MSYRTASCYDIFYYLSVLFQLSVAYSENFKEIKAWEVLKFLKEKIGILPIYIAWRQKLIVFTLCQVCTLYNALFNALFNATIGMDSKTYGDWDNILGSNNSSRVKTNTNRELFLKYCSEKKLKIINTFFAQREYIGELGSTSQQV